MGKLVGKDLLDFLANANRTYDWQMTDMENSVVYALVTQVKMVLSLQNHLRLKLSSVYPVDMMKIEELQKQMVMVFYVQFTNQWMICITYHLLGQEFDYKSFAQYQEGKTWWEIQSFDPSIPESCSEELMEKLCKLALELGQLSTDDGELDEYLISNGIAFDSVGFANLLWKSFLQIRQIYTQLEDTYANIEVADLFQYYDDDSINNRNDALEYVNGMIDELVDQGFP